MDSIIRINNLKKYFGRLHAVDDISFDIKKGEIFGFLGPNGAGKSTTIRCMMGFNNPTDGEIKILGHDMTKDSSSAKKYIGYLPGNMKLYDRWSGWDHIRFFEGVRGKSKNVNELIERLNFDPTAKFRHLSSGNKQKLGLILALMNDPKLLIMDEPTVGLDPLLMNEIYKILLEMRKQGTTIFISSHNLPEVEKLCDRVAIIKQGKVVATEQISELVKKKLHKIEVRFAGKVLPTEFKIPGVERVDEITGGLAITISGDLNQLISVLSKHKVVDLELSHASLEDIFLKYYEKGL